MHMRMRAANKEPYQTQNKLNEI